VATKSHTQLEVLNALQDIELEVTFRSHSYPLHPRYESLGISVIVMNESSQYKEDKAGKVVILHDWTITILFDAQPHETHWSTLLTTSRVMPCEHSYSPLAFSLGWFWSVINKPLAL
jgi:hypothetical protein